MKPYSDDLRRKIIAAYENNDYSQQQVAKLFGVSPATVRNLVRRKRETGGEYPLTGPKRKAKVEILPLVHYIWWGNPVNDQQALDASKTPNQLASLGRVCVH